MFLFQINISYHAQGENSFHQEAVSILAWSLRVLNHILWEAAVDNQHPEILYVQKESSNVQA